VDIALVVLTILSLGVALVSVLAFQGLKDLDQRRSDARVAALAAAAGAASPASDDLLLMPQLDTVVNRPSSIVNRPSAWVERPDSKVEHAPAMSADPGTSFDKTFFGTVQRETPTSGRFAFVAAAALILAIGGAVVVFTTSGHGKDGSSASAAAHRAPLELVSLGHSREDSMLTISGMVRNPASGPTLEGLTAVVSLIDAYGGVISTRDVPLDYRALGPGEEAPFTVTVPDPGSAARYRVSFRAGADVIPHVDRRSNAKLASAL
jgi:hypothetical protein